MPLRGPFALSGAAGEAEACLKQSHLLRKRETLAPYASAGVASVVAQRRHALATTKKTMSQTPILTIRHLSAVFPDANGGLRALDDVSFDVYPREFICVLGPSGSGKTTLLRILAGLISPTSGSFKFGHGEQPSTGMVFQQANLMPWRSVIENIKLPLEVKQMDEGSARHKAQEMIELVGLQGFEDSLPRDLSGGMAQRVAIARALIHDPDLSPSVPSTR
jgi:ABC-type Fe3+/spermidine/putrescine transport system ATPase subunit